MDEILKQIIKYRDYGSPLDPIPMAFVMQDISLIVRLRPNLSMSEFQKISMFVSTLPKAARGSKQAILSWLRHPGGVRATKW